VKLKCIVIDDEPLARKVLHEYVSLTEDLELIGVAENAAKGKLLLEQSYVDIIFLNIEMPYLNGLEFLKTIERKPMIIFTTAFQKYALEGFELDIVDFLLKPIPFGRFRKAIQKAKEFHSYKTSIEIQRDDYFFIKVGYKFEKIFFDDILYAEAMNNYVTLYTTNNRLLCYITFKIIESELPVDKFIKTHKSFIVSVSHIEGIEGNQIKINEVFIPVSRTYKAAVEAALKNKLVSRKRKD
jgi:two-component system, LytTR family, response regulator